MTSKETGFTGPKEAPRQGGIGFKPCEIEEAELEGWGQRRATGESHRKSWAWQAWPYKDIGCSRLLLLAQVALKCRGFFGSVFKMVII